jgi:HipA-like protein
MRQAAVYLNGQQAGTLIESDQGKFIFRYEDLWFAEETKPAISLGLPKTQQAYESDYLFPFFFNMLSEGVNRKLQCRRLKIDDEDDFGLLLATANTDTIGAVTVQALPS